MEVISPSYYQSFCCLASACPDSCCKDWAVQIDEASAQRYRMLPGELGNDLRKVMCEEDGDIILALTKDGRCPMWRQDGLCRIQAQLGETALCLTCAQFPRIHHDFGDFVELGLELSCPEAARLILSARTCSTTSVQIPGGEPPEYDPLAMAILQRSRTQILEFLQNTTFTVGQALAVMLLYGYAVQDELYGSDSACFSPEAALAEAHSLAVPGSMDDLLEFYRELEILTPAWRELLSQPSHTPWSEEHRALARYFVSRYWLQAVSDLDLISRVKLTICSCLVVKALGGDIYRTAQLYSKEIENDADNIVSILDGTYTSPALTDIKLLGLLLAES